MADPQETKRKRFLITGRVHGVGFRWFTMQSAQNHGLVGWVRNQRDGTVLCEAQGPPAAVADLLADLRQGPDFSRVKQVQEEELPTQKGGTAEASFEIR